MLALHASSLCLLHMGARPCLKLYGHAGVAHCSHTATQRCNILAMLTPLLSAQHHLALTAACSVLHFWISQCPDANPSFFSLSADWRFLNPKSQVYPSLSLQCLVAHGPLSCKSPCTLVGLFLASPCCRPQHCIPITCRACRTTCTA